jgi:hypothetical protein
LRSDYTIEIQLYVDYLYVPAEPNVGLPDGVEIEDITLFIGKELPTTPELYKAIMDAYGTEIEECCYEDAKKQRYERETWVGRARLRQEDRLAEEFRTRQHALEGL